MNEEDEGDRSDLETRYKEREEREAGESEIEKRKREIRQMEWEIDRQMKDIKNQGKEKGKGNKKENKIFNKMQAGLKKVKEREQKYEALSWCWGEPSEDYAILIQEEGKTYRKKVRKDLALALKYLREPGRDRYLWVDAICIDQDNPNERNHQVQMMSRIYTRAERVCIWLGEADETSDMAMQFIDEEIKHLRNFDMISSSTQYIERWQALMLLMQRKWFFRRWVVQEIALAQAATVYCGAKSVPWKLFAIAVELFVETETATHRLSDSLKRDGNSSHVPGQFDNVSELGASQLVQATGKVFRSKATPMEQDVDESDEENNKLDRVRYREKLKRKREEEDKQTEMQLREMHTIDPLDRRSLLSLEYLVSTMSIFQASEPRDVVYALLALARDASPFAPSLYGQDDQNLLLIMTLLDQFLAEKPFTVDYNRPYSDVSRDFVEFTIMRAHKIDSVQALDILCRPWALEPPKERSKWLKQNKIDTRCGNDHAKRRMMPKRTKWSIGVLPKGDKHAPSVWRKDDRSTDEYWLEVEKAYTRINDKTLGTCSELDCRHEYDPDKKFNCWISRMKERYLKPRGPGEDTELPSWVARASQAPFLLDHAPGLPKQKTSRANADSLVGPPLEGHRNYNAAGSRKLDLKKVIFRKRPALGHYSLYVEGFVLDEVKHVGDQSQLGGIPTSWLTMGGWQNFNKDPPDEFWRTIVADRGRHNRNPPHYYARACKEAVQRGGHRGGCVNTEALINNEQNFVVAEFCRRVQAVIWNRRLFRTECGRLGISSNVKEGDMVCILYGCTVPVILRRHEKPSYVDDDSNDDDADENNRNNNDDNNDDDNVDENNSNDDNNDDDNDNSDDRNVKKYQLSAWSHIDPEIEEDRVEILKACVLRMENNRMRRKRYRMKKKQYKDRVFREMMDSRYSCSENTPDKIVRKTLAGAVAKLIQKKPPRQRKINDLATAIVRTAYSSGKANYETILEDINNNGIEEYLKPIEDVRNIEEEEQEIPAGNGETEVDGETEVGGETEAGDQTAEGEPENKAGKSFWYEFMSECYLHGMMDGEAMREKFYTDKKECIFEIR